MLFLGPHLPDTEQSIFHSESGGRVVKYADTFRVYDGALPHLRHFLEQPFLFLALHVLMVFLLMFQETLLYRHIILILLLSFLRTFHELLDSLFISLRGLLPHFLLLCFV